MLIHPVPPQHQSASGSDTIVPPLDVTVSGTIVKVVPLSDMEVEAMNLFNQRTKAYFLKKDTVYNSIKHDGTIQIYDGLYLSAPIKKEYFKTLDAPQYEYMSMVLFITFVVFIISLPFWLPDAIKKVIKTND